MLFASYTYVVFLIAVVATRWLVPARWVAPILLLASYLFYASAEPSHLLLLVLATAVGFGFGLAIESRPTKRALLGAAVAVPLALLGYFKYADFVVAQWGGLLAALGAPAPTGPNVALPLAISFFTFQIVSYVIDVRRGASAERNPIRFALYLAFFPQLVAGPIVRASELIPQLRLKRAWNDLRFVEGGDLIARGYVKKLVFADNLGPYADALFAAPSSYDSASTWVCVFSYAGQIYCDFSAYTDLARGSAKLLGYELPENFDLPYASQSITEFWRRWHITLSRFLRDYLYVSLGGNRMGRAKAARNLIVTMALGGLWHGASWTFVLWGLCHGALLFTHKAIDRAWESADRATRERVRESRAYAALATTTTFLSVALLWVLFRAGSLDVAFEVYRGMLGLGRDRVGAVLPEPIAKAAALLALLATVHIFAAIRRPEPLYVRAPLPLRGFAWTSALGACYLLGGAGQTFIYFEF